MQFRSVVLLIVVCASHSHSQSAVHAKLRIADPATYLAEIRSELRKAWPQHRSIVIVCHGHSVPAGYFATPEVRTFDAYPHLTHVAIRNQHPTSLTSLICTAIGGENAEEGARRFDEDVLAKKPDVVTIDYALNDRRIGLERARRAWVSMIERARAANVKVVLLTPTPDTRVADLHDRCEPLVQHANQIRRLAAEYEVGLVDSLALFLKFKSAGGELGDLMSQPNHPNRQGHELVAEDLAKWFLPP